MTRTFFIIIFAVLSAILIGSCKTDDDLDCPDGYIQVDGECVPVQHVMTTVILKLTNDSTGNETEFEFSDIDGIGGNDPVVDTVFLDTSASYNNAIEVWDESSDPVENLTSHIDEYADIHQFFFNIDNTLNLTVNYNDEDANGWPVGLATIYITGGESTGNLNIVLKHQVNGKDGNQSTGNTDIDVTFPVVISH